LKSIRIAFLNGQKLIGMLALMLFQGCAITQNSAADTNDTQNKGMGVIVFSLTHDVQGGPDNNVLLYRYQLPYSFGKRETYQSNERNIFSVAKPGDFPSPSGSGYLSVYGYLHVVPVPVGEHEFQSWNITAQNGTLSIYPKNAKPLKFTVAAGEVVYLGAFHGHLKQGKNLLRMEITGDGFVSVRDDRERDMALLYKRYPQYRNQVKYEVLREGNWYELSN
jgi:hypothetical protein